jgi:dolichol-phosphate mannosyltransferase
MIKNEIVIIKGENMKISIVVPIYNESQNIVNLIQEINGHLRGRQEYEILIVDDGSSDRTQEILAARKQSFPEMRLIRHPGRYGQSTALVTGIRNAAYPLIVIMDGDGQNDPKDIDSLLKIHQQWETRTIKVMVAGYRRQRHDTRWRKWSSWIANTTRSLILGDHTPDSACGLKVFSRELFDCLPTFDHMHRFLPALVLRAGGKVITVEVNHRFRWQGQSHYGTLDRLTAGIVDLCGVLWLKRRSLDLRTVDICSACREQNKTLLSLFPPVGQ